MHPLEDVHPLGPLRGERRLGRRNDARIAGRAEFALRIGLVSLLDGRFRVVTNHPTGAEDEISMADLTEAEVWDAIQASAAIPFVFPPVWIRGHIGAWNALARRLPPEVRATEPYRRLRALVGRKRRAALYEYYPEVFYGRRNAATEFRPQAIRRYYEHGLEIARAHPRGNGPSLP